MMPSTLGIWSCWPGRSRSAFGSVSMCSRRCSQHRSRSDTRCQAPCRPRRLHSGSGAGAAPPPGRPPVRRCPDQALLHPRRRRLRETRQCAAASVSARAPAERSERTGLRGRRILEARRPRRGRAARSTRRAVRAVAARSARCAGRSPRDHQRDQRDHHDAVHQGVTSVRAPRAAVGRLSPPGPHQGARGDGGSAGGVTRPLIRRAPALAHRERRRAALDRNVPAFAGTPQSLTIDGDAKPAEAGVPRISGSCWGKQAGAWAGLAARSPRS